MFGSAAAHIGCTPEVVYSTLKAAVVHYTRCLALELKEHGVRVNAVSPGATKTARFQATRTVDPARMEIGKSLNRYAEPAEIADAVAFLVFATLLGLLGTFLSVSKHLSEIQPR